MRRFLARVAFEIAAYLLGLAAFVGLAALAAVALLVGGAVLVVSGVKDETLYLFENIRRLRRSDTEGR